MSDEQRERDQMKRELGLTTLTNHFPSDLMVEADPVRVHLLRCQYEAGECINNLTEGMVTLALEVRKGQHATIDAIKKAAHFIGYVGTTIMVVLEVLRYWGGH